RAQNQSRPRREGRRTKARVMTGRLHFSVRGPLNIARPPQGYPVLVQAGSSEAGVRFAAEFAEVVFTAQPSLESGKHYYADLKEEARGLGREDGQVLVMPSIVAVVGRTKEEASDKLEKLQAYTHTDVMTETADRWLGFVTNLRAINFESLVPTSLPQTNFIQSRQKVLLELAARQKLTWRQLIRLISNSRGHLMVVGTPDEIAHTMIDAFDQYAADGFNVIPPIVPSGLKDFVELVVPELRRRGKYRSRTQATSQSVYASGLSVHLEDPTLPPSERARRSLSGSLLARHRLEQEAEIAAGD
ncbi:LLM class flavin-dependent oxidoreductase, partial [Bradyrhizobium elkanii]|uniref:LLM class flavin-dependent oxidoreductase n=1 Tax=Bradyrhizobium elkanii TaxID=29448 RepID=UPI001BA936A4